MTKQGFILLHRSLLNNPIWNIKPYSKGQAWVTLLMLCNHYRNLISIKNGELIEINRGECGYSELALSELFGWSRSKTKNFLNLLKNEKMIQQKIVGNHSIIRVLNYDTYQNIQQNVQQNVQQTIQQTVQQKDINNNDNNDNNDNKKEPKQKKRDIFFDKDIQELKKYFESKTNEILHTKDSLEKLNDLLDNLNGDVSLVKKLIDKSAHKGHRIGVEFKPLSFNSICKNANSILNDTYQLVSNGFIDDDSDVAPF